MAKGEWGMGFMGISNLNVSLLGKHLWRIQIGKSSLLSEVLKSKYFPRITIQEDKQGYAPSYVWRSILRARDVVMEAF